MNIPTSVIIANAFRAPGLASQHQDAIREAMLRARAPGQIAALPVSVAGNQASGATGGTATSDLAQAQDKKTQTLFRVFIRHLGQGVDTRDGMLNALRIAPCGPSNTALRMARDMGLVTTIQRGRFAWLELTPRGYAALAAMGSNDMRGAA